MRLLVLDNYDSFTWNLVQYLGELGAEPVVYRNDAISVEEAVGLAPGAIVVSPGPGTPGRAGIAVALVRAALEAGIPLLGVCLGHQALGAALGARVVRAERLMHGKGGAVAHSGAGLFTSLENPCSVMRYHSLVVEGAALPPELEVTAWSADRPRGNEVMALAHRSRPAWGVQFHPESIGTDSGRTLLGNFLSMAAGSPPQGRS